MQGGRTHAVVDVVAATTHRRPAAPRAATDTATMKLPSTPCVYFLRELASTTNKLKSFVHFPRQVTRPRGIKEEGGERAWRCAERMARGAHGLARLVVAGMLLAARAPTGALHIGDRLARRETAAAAAAAAEAGALPAVTPPMGWNSWYALGGERGWAHTTEGTIRETADALRETGLAAAGYRCCCRRKT